MNPDEGRPAHRHQQDRETTGQFADSGTEHSPVAT